MTRESRHLKISHLSEPIDEQKLLEYFRNYGRVQKLELLKDEPGAVIVSFMDMRTASKALGVDHAVAGHPVRASYYEPGSTGLSTTVIQIYDSDESLLHSRPSGAGPAPTSQQQQQQQQQLQQQQPPSQESRRSSSGQHGSIGNKNYGRGSTNPATWSSGGPSSSSSTWQEGVNYECVSGGGGGGGFREPLGRSNGLEANSQQPRRPLSRLSGGGGGSRLDRGSRKRSDSSGSPKTGGGVSSSPANSRRSSASRSRSQSPCGSPSRSLGGGRYSIDSRHQQQSARDDGGRGSSGGSGCSPKEQATIVVRSLPRRSTDSSIKDGLFFTYKKHAKVVSVKVIGSGSDRYALVTFRRAPDASKAITATNGEMFFGSRIVVEMAPLGLDGDDNERRPLEKDIDQYHSKSSRTLYVGNLENRITPEQLKQIFERFGDVLDVDIKNRETPAPFAFVQFADIVSVVKAIHAMEQDGYIGSNKIKVGFGKPLPSPMVWLDELPSHVNEEYLTRKMNFYGTITDVLIDKNIRQALVTYESIEAAQSAVSDMKGRTINSRKVQIDFCSRELHDLFVDRMFRCGKNQRATTTTAPIVGANSTSGGPSTAVVNLSTSTASSSTTTQGGRPTNAGRKTAYDYYGNDSYYDSTGLNKGGYGPRGVASRNTGAAHNDYTATGSGSGSTSTFTRDHTGGEYNGARSSTAAQDSLNQRTARPRGRSASPSKFASAKHQHRHDESTYHEEAGSGRGGNFQRSRLARNSRSPPARYGAYNTSSRDSSRDKARQRRPLARDDSGGRAPTTKRPRTPPGDQTLDRKPSATRRQRYRQGEDDEENDDDEKGRRRKAVDGDESSTSDDESESSSSPSSSSSSVNRVGSPATTATKSATIKNSESRTKLQLQPPGTSIVPSPIPVITSNSVGDNSGITKISTSVAPSTSTLSTNTITAATAAAAAAALLETSTKDRGSEMNKLQRERERLLQVLEHMAADDEKSGAVVVAASAVGQNLKPKLGDVFDLDWVKTTAEQEQKTRRQSSAGIDLKLEPESPQNAAAGTSSILQRQSSVPVSFEQEDRGQQRREDDETDELDREEADVGGQFRRRKRPAQLRTSTGGSSEPEIESGPSLTAIRSLDEPEHDSEIRIKSESLDESNENLRTSNVVNVVVSGKSKGGSAETSTITTTPPKKSIASKSSLSNKTKTIPMEIDSSAKSMLSDPRSNPSTIENFRDLPLPNFAGKRLLSRPPHQATVGGGSENQKTSLGDTPSKEQTTVKVEIVTGTNDDANAATRKTIECGLNCRQNHVHHPTLQHSLSQEGVQRHAFLRQRNSSASEQLSPLISSGGEFSATDSDGALMSPPGGGAGDGSLINCRVWGNAAVDIFGEALSPPSTGGPTNTSGGVASGNQDASNRRSLEERIRALDAKFSALDQMIKGAKERPQQSIRQITVSSATAAAAAGGNIDYSKYKVVKKPSLCGVPSSPSASTPTGILPDGLMSKTGGGLLNSHQRTSAFDYDSQRLLGNFATTAPIQDESNNWSIRAPTVVANKTDAPTLSTTTNSSRTTSVSATITSPPAETVATSSSDSTKQNQRPLTIAIPPAPLSSSSSSAAPTPGGNTPLSPTGMPLQGILKNKPRTPTGEASSQQPHQDPRTAARKDSLKSPTIAMPAIELPPVTSASTPISNATTKMSSIASTKPNVVQTQSGAKIPVVGGTIFATAHIRPPAPVTVEQGTKTATVLPKSDVRQPWISRVPVSSANTSAESKTEKTPSIRPIDRSYSVSSMYGGNISNAKSSSGVDVQQTAVSASTTTTTTTAEHLRKMSTPVSNQHRIDTIAPPIRELRNKELDELFHSRSSHPSKEDGEHEGSRNLPQLPKIMKKDKSLDKPGSAIPPSMINSEKSKRPETKEKEKKESTEKEKEKHSSSKLEKKEKSHSSTTTITTSGDKDRKLLAKTSHQELQQRHSSSASSETSSLMKRDKEKEKEKHQKLSSTQKPDKEKEKEKSDKPTKPSISNNSEKSSFASKLLASKKLKEKEKEKEKAPEKEKEKEKDKDKEKEKLKKKSRKEKGDDSDEEKSVVESVKSVRSSDSDDSSDDTSDDGRRNERKLAKEWKQVLACLSEEPAGLSMYDRVKRRSSASYTDPWKQGKSSKGSSSSANANQASSSSKMDKFLLLREKRAKKLGGKGGPAATSGEENEDDDDDGRGGEGFSATADDSSKSSDSSASSDDQRRRGDEEDNRRKKSALKKLQQQKKQKEQREAQKRISNLNSSTKKTIDEKEKDKKMRLSIADVFSSEASTGSESEANFDKRDRKHLAQTKDSSDNDRDHSPKAKKSHPHSPKNTEKPAKKKFDETKSIEKDKEKEREKEREKEKEKKISSTSLQTDKRPKQPPQDSSSPSSKRGPGRPPKQTKSDSGDNLPSEKSVVKSKKDKSDSSSFSKIDKKETKKFDDSTTTIPKKQKHSDEDDEERRLRKKRKMEKLLAEKMKSKKERSTNEKSRDSMSTEDGASKSKDERTKSNVKRVRTDDSESQSESLTAKKRRKLSSPVSSPTSSCSNISMIGQSISTTSSGLLTKAAMKQVETPSIVSASSSPPSLLQPPKLLTKAAMKAVDTKIDNEERPASIVKPKELSETTIQSLDNADVSADIVAALKRSREEDKEEEKDDDNLVIMEDNPLEVSMQEEVIEATERIDADEEERQAAAAAVSLIEKELRAREENETASISESSMDRASAEPLKVVGVKDEPLVVISMKKEAELLQQSPPPAPANLFNNEYGDASITTNEERSTIDDSSSNNAANADDKTKPLSVEVDMLPILDENGHQVLSEQKSDVSHVDEIIDDVVHGYVEIDAEKLIKMSNAANKAAAAAATTAIATAAAAAASTQQQQQPRSVAEMVAAATSTASGLPLVNFQSTPTTTPNFLVSTAPVSMPQQQPPPTKPVQPPSSCARMGLSPQVSQPQENLFSSQPSQHSDLALRHQQQQQLQQFQQQQQLQQKAAEMGLQFTQRFPDAPISRPLTLPTDASSGFQHQQRQQQQSQPQQQTGVSSGFGQNLATVTTQLGFQLPASTTTAMAFGNASPMLPRASQQQQQRMPSVSHHQFMPTTPVTPSTNQAPPPPYSQIPPATPTTAVGSGLTSGLPTYAAQQYAAFLELQQKQAAWASANLLQQSAASNAAVSNGGGVLQQPRYSVANTTQLPPPSSTSQSVLDQGLHFREYLAEQQRQQQQQQQQQLSGQQSTQSYHQQQAQQQQQQQQQQLAMVENHRVPRLLNSYPIVWQGCLVLKNDSALVQMHYVSGAQHLIKRSMPEAEEGSHFAVLRISQRMRLENQQLEGVHRRMQLPEEHCVLVALPCGQNRGHIAEQGGILQNAFINYLTQKQAAGIVNVTQPGSTQTSHVVHIFPPCEFSDHYLLDSANDFLLSIRDHETSYLFVVVTTVVQVM